MVDVVVVVVAAGNTGDGRTVLVWLLQGLFDASPQKDPKRVDNGARLCAGAAASMDKQTGVDGVVAVVINVVV
jgi:hypothetical protein